MSKNPWIQQFEAERPKYEKLTIKLRQLIGELLEQNGIDALIEARTKEISSFSEKIDRDGKSYTNPLEEITDLSGIRIIAQSLADLDRLSKLIKKEFVVDTTKSSDKITNLDEDQFGYLSQHYIISLNKARSKLAEWQDVNNLCAEIQIRTVLQHAWAVVSHSLSYKTTLDIPKQLRRRLFRLSALFELADAEFDQIRKEAASISRGYKSSISSKKLKIDINLDSLREYLKTSQIVNDYCETVDQTQAKTYVNNDGENLSQLITLLNRVELDTIDKLDKHLRVNQAWLKAFIVEYTSSRIKHAVEKDPKKAETSFVMSRPAVVRFLLIGLFPDILDQDFLISTFNLKGSGAKIVVDTALRHNPRTSRT